MSVRVAVERAEEARAVLIELFPEGFEEVTVDGGIEFAAYTKAGGEERLWQVFGPGAATDVEAGWNEAWKRFHRPVQIDRLWVGPPWEEPGEGLVPVVVDPGLAFGTGAHPTTQLCLRFLLEHEPVSLLDLGCGSGVLSIAAAKLGYAPVTAFDLDDAAVAATQANAEVNDVELAVERRDVLSEPLPPAELTLANIASEPLREVAGRIESAELVASGYLVSEELELEGWSLVERKELQGWVADLFVQA
ncbi:MAG TPA: 50S ribosomal protein L11 methyltransferase [Gaiellaceae bacterium]|nr:50S ribosomal protein L11 methyltransferase [Gaiellaceae bacterium]